MDTICVERRGGAWALKHAGSVLGYASSLAEAAAVGEALVSSLKSDGRPARLLLPPTRSAEARPGLAS